MKIIGLPAVRCKVDGTPGMGNQGNTIDVLDYFCGLGFSGKVELVYRDHALAKVLTLLGIDDHAQIDEKATFQYNGLDIILITHSYFMDHKDEFDEMAVGFSGGQLETDTTNMALLYKTESFMLIPPFNMFSPAAVWHKRQFPKHEPDDLVIDQAVVPVKKISFADLQMHSNQISNPAARQNLFHILRKHLEGECIIQSIYGVKAAVETDDYPRELILLNLVLAAAHTSRGVKYLFFHQSLIDEERKNLYDIIQHNKWPAAFVEQFPFVTEISRTLELQESGLKFTSLADMSSVETGSNHVVLVEAPLPKVYYDYLISQTEFALPPVMEGLSSINKRIQRGPFIQSFYYTHGQRINLAALTFKDTSEAFEELMHQASFALGASNEMQERLWLSGEYEPHKVLEDFYAATEAFPEFLNGFANLQAMTAAHDKVGMVLKLISKVEEESAGLPALDAKTRSQLRLDTQYASCEGDRVVFCGSDSFLAKLFLDGHFSLAKKLLRHVPDHPSLVRLAQLSARQQQECADVLEIEDGANYRTGDTEDVELKCIRHLLLTHTPREVDTRATSLAVVPGMQDSDGINRFRLDILSSVLINLQHMCGIRVVTTLLDEVLKDMGMPFLAWLVPRLINIAYVILFLPPNMAFQMYLCVGEFFSRLLFDQPEKYRMVLKAQVLMATLIHNGRFDSRVVMQVVAVNIINQVAMEKVDQLTRIAYQRTKEAFLEQSPVSAGAGAGVSNSVLSTSYYQAYCARLEEEQCTSFPNNYSPYNEMMSPDGSLKVQKQP